MSHSASLNGRNPLLLVYAFAVLFAFACNREQVDAPPTIRFITDSIGRQLEISREMARQFEAETGIRVEFQIGPNSADDRLAEYQKFFNARSAHADVYQVDVIWPGLLAPHLIDLTGAIDPDDFFPAMIDTGTVDGRLICVPFYADAGLLYFRTDLLEKYGFDGPPDTLDELEHMARTIAEGERPANPAFQGIVFQGAAYEGLTCNALEWQTGAGGGNFIGENGEPNLLNEKALAVFEQIRGWIGTIAPRGALAFMEEDARAVFQSGNAAFMRNWPYAWKNAQDEGSPIRGKVDVAPMPGVERPAATLGGWTLAVSRYSRHPDAARQFVAYLSSHEAQLRRAVEGGYFATRPDVYTEPAVEESVPFYPQMRDVFESAVARPAGQSGRYYSEVSAAYYRAVHDILSGNEEARPRLERADREIREILARP